MDKPEYKHHSPPALDWHLVEDYIEAKYKCKLRGFGRPDNYYELPFEETKKIPYLDFWYYLIECNENVSNGSFIYVPEPHEGQEPWQRQICEWIHAEFENDMGDVFCWVAW